MTDVKGQRVTVAGLGRFGGGIAVCRWLVEQAAGSITVSDRDPVEKLADSVLQLAGLPITFHLGHQPPADFTDTDLVIASPAVPPHDPLLQAARAAGVAVTTEICLFVERCPAWVVGVTGTKGKSTTSALLHRMLAGQITAGGFPRGTAGRTVWLGGNIGKSLLGDLPCIAPADTVVLELSSFMLHYLGARHWSPRVAVVTLLAEDHLDWHGSAAAYHDAKRNITRFQKAGDIAVLNDADPYARPFADTPATVRWFGPGTLPRFELKLVGEHNQLNAQAAFAAAGALGVTWDAAQAAVREFPGLPHRLQVITERDGVRYINDSIATIPEAAIAALHAFPRGRVIQIVGGSLKKDPPITEMCAALARHAKAVLLIGESASKLQAAMPSAVLAIACGDLATAVAHAHRLALPGDVVLLSPGYASYDQFVNFEQRGEQFAKLANA